MAAGSQKEIEAIAHDLESGMDSAVMKRLKAPFKCTFSPLGRIIDIGRWRIADANDDAIASVAASEEGYARLIVKALNAYFARGER
jgi:hypothetical protein